MAAPKAQTLQQRFGFLDTELATQDHDAVMLWLEKKLPELSDRIVGWTGGFSEELVSCLVQDAQEWVSKQIAETQVKLDALNNNCYLPYTNESLTEMITNLREWRMPDVPTVPTNTGLGKTRWEVPIKNKNYTIGFVDMMITISKLELSLEGLPKYWVRDYGDYLPKFCVFRHHYSVAFEVKTSVKSLGELLRQINMYRQYLDDSTFYIVVPEQNITPESVETLASQYVGTIKYPSGDVRSVPIG